MVEQGSKKLSTEPCKGMRDLYPKDMFIQNYIFGMMRQVVARYGYEEYDGPLLEGTELYRAKTGEEIVSDQTYSFQDRGGRDLTIRPEMTPTVARMVAGKTKDLAFPLRWYSIPNLFRYERPQRGRLREHWQLNVDVFSLDSLEADAEIISVAYDIMKQFGAKEEDFQIKINDRRIIDAMMKDTLRVDEGDAYRLSKLIDRRAKMPQSDFMEQVKAILGSKTDLLLDYLSIKEIGQVSEELPGASAIKELFKQLKIRGIENCVFDPMLIRGFDYYTATVFEVFDTDPVNNRSLFGGGRYDDLVGLFGGEKISGIGFGMGDVTIRDFMEARGLLPVYQSAADVYLCIISLESMEFANQLASYLRVEGVKVVVDYTGRKVAAQVRTADRQSVPFVICIGDSEAASRQFKIKDLKDGSEQTTDWDSLPTLIKQQISHNVVC